MKSVKITETMYAMIESAEASVRGELLDALLVYAFGGERRRVGAPTYEGVLTCLYNLMDAQLRKADEIRAKRAKAGKAHKGNQYQIGLDLTKLEQNGTNGTNGTSVPKILKDNELQDPNVCARACDNNNSLYNYIYNNSTERELYKKEKKKIKEKKIEESAETLMTWLADNVETLQLLIHRNKLANEVGTMTTDELLEVVRPYVSEFVQMESVREDIAQGKRRNVKSHFGNWLRVYLNNNNNHGNSNDKRGTADLPPKPTKQDYFNI